MLSLMQMVTSMTFAVVPAFAGAGPGQRPSDTTTPPQVTSPQVTLNQVVTSCVGSAQITGAGVVYFNA